MRLQRKSNRLKAFDPTTFDLTTTIVTARSWHYARELGGYSSDREGLQCDRSCMMTTMTKEDIISSRQSNRAQCKHTKPRQLATVARLSTKMAVMCG
ncbi:hypothetical protein M3J09_011295 [Ascochyta lentis]